MTVETIEENASVASLDDSLRLSDILEQDEIDSEANEEPQTEEERKVQSETRAVKYLKILVVAVLVLAGLAVSLVAYFRTRASETDEFEAAFETNANKLIEAFYHDTQTRMWTAASLSASFTSYARANNQNWPNVTIPDFGNRIAPLTQVILSPAVIFAPLVTKETRKGWESYALASLPPEVSESLPIKGIFGMGPDGSVAPEDEDSKGPYFPTWQVHASENVQAGPFFNTMSIPPIKYAIDAMLQGKMPSMSRIFPVETRKDNEPIGSMSTPIFDDFDHTTVVGALLMEIDWARYFEQNSLAGEHSNTVVLENTCGQQYTFHVHGDHAEYLGEGDLHDPKHDDMEYASSFDDFRGLFLNWDEFAHQREEEPDSQDSHVANDTGSCDYAIRVYPDDECSGAFQTNLPIVHAATVAAIFAFTIIVFCTYDLVVEHRQGLVMKNAARSNKIVHSLFPANVRERLFKTASTNNFDEPQGRKRLLSLRQETPTLRLKTFLSNPNGSRHHSELAGTTRSKPIADLFPNTTVMFADIAGFTAWSSEREPHQVFELLETLYSAFDKVARALGVFKVETIGDAYVAVTGLPDPSDDHAAIMARFAYECQRLMQELTKKLEISLGPGTADLALRVGLHSGPVTAGVLRGDKSRFQLFGDTMNTAARMESTGQRDKIQVSEATAGLLIAAEKPHWIQRREDLVMAKGKGEMQTYWLEPRRTSPQNEENDVHNELQADSSNGILWGETSGWGELSLGKITIDQGAAAKKEQRLIDWNVEMLYGFLLNIAKGHQTMKSQSSRRFLRSLSKRSVQGNSADVSPMADSSSSPTDSVLGEVTEVVSLAEFDATSVRARLPDSLVMLNSDVRDQLRDYVTRIAAMYRSVPFHNFEHASHVTMSANKLIKRIVAPKEISGGKTLHEATFGISADPLAQFAVVFSALIHDVDHKGVTNAQLVKEKADIALAYNNKSVAEKQSLCVGWTILMEPRYEALRSCIYSSELERKRFRQLVINTVMATDVIDRDLQLQRQERWAKSFQDSAMLQADFDAKLDRNRKAMVVIEYLIQASDVAHTMQHWHIFRKWNERLFQEKHNAFVAGRLDSDPSVGWYKCQISFFDNYAIPLAMKLKECGVFGVSSDEYLAYALENRREWETKGNEVVQSMIDTVKAKDSLVVENVGRDDIV